ncbi:hypothetical protein [Leptothrix ochracea]
MKIILSRKGFDAENGGIPSPILPDGTLVPLPIPSDSGRPLAEIYSPAGSLSQLVNDLGARGLSSDQRVHLDPDLRAQSLVTRHPNWRPAFGQTHAAQGHLDRQHVDKGDLFLFFGWFRRVELHEQHWRYVADAPQLHCLFGWLQIGQILRLEDEGTSEDALCSWHDHPHVQLRGAMGSGNTLYVASEQRTGSDQAGGGQFPCWTPQRQLTAPGESRSVWRLPGWMDPTSPLGLSMSYHRNPARWRKDGEHTTLQSVAKGQEFVMDVGSNSAEAHQWIDSLFLQP